MDSELADHRDNSDHDHVPLDSSADSHESNQILSMTSSDLPPTDDSFNGDLHHHLPSPDPLASKHTEFSADIEHADLSAEIERSIADNQVLVDEIASLRDARAAMEHSRELLQQELLGSSERVEALSAEIASLDVEKRKHEDLAACMAQEAHALHAQKMDLQAENGNTASETKSLDAMLAETKEKSYLIARDVDEKQAAMAVAQTRVHMICFEVAKLQHEKEEYSKEVSLLNASNGTIDTQINQLKEEEKALSNGVDQIAAAKAMVEQKLSNAEASIAALSVQVSTLTETDEDMQRQLCAAKERLGRLEEQDKAMALRERDMEMCIESRMHILKANFDTTEKALEREKEASSRALEVTHMKATASERDVHVLELPSDVKQQHVQDLQCRLSELHEEKEALRLSNDKLQAELRKTQEKPEVEESSRFKENIKRLEGTVNEAEERAHLSESKEIDLRCKLQELAILAKRRPTLAGWAAPLMISGGTVVALGLLVYLLRSNSKSK